MVDTSNLALPVLTTLNLDRNRIKKVVGLRGLKKLEELSLEGNLIEDASMQDVGFKLINLQELNLSSNRITHVGRLIGYPKVQSVALDNNAITEIEGAAFHDCPDLQKLSISNIKLPNYTGDLKFLHRCPNLLELRMNSCFVDRDLKDVSAFPDMFQMRKFTMRDVGLIRTTDLHFKMPLLEVLDLQDNRVYEVEAIDDLANFTSLVEVNFSSNPVNVHASLQ